MSQEVASKLFVIAEDTDLALSVCGAIELSHSTSINNFRDHNDISVSVDESGYITQNSVIKVTHCPATA